MHHNGILNSCYIADSTAVSILKADSVTYQWYKNVTQVTHNNFYHNLNNEVKLSMVIMVSSVMQSTELEGDLSRNGQYRDVYKRTIEIPQCTRILRLIAV